MSEKNSYQIANFAESIDHEIARLKGQVELFWVKEERCLRMFGLRDGMTILECGCGPGYLMEKLLTTFPNSDVTGIEIDHYLVEKCQEMLSPYSGKRAHVYEQSIIDMDFPAERFDFVISRMVLEHLEDPLLAVKEVYRVLKTGGKAVFIDNDFDLHLRAYPDIPELNDLYTAYCTCRIAEGGQPNIGRQLPGILQEGGFSNIDLEIVSAHSRLIGDKAFLKSEGSGIPAKLVKDGYLSREIFDRLAKKWHDALKQPKHAFFRQLFVSVGEKLYSTGVQFETEPKLGVQLGLPPGANGFLNAPSMEDRWRLIIAYLKVQIASFLETDEECLPPDQPLISLGVDSIISVELANRLGAEFGIAFSAMDILDSLSISAMATCLNSEIEKRNQTNSRLAASTELVLNRSETNEVRGMDNSDNDHGQDWEKGFI